MSCGCELDVGYTRRYVTVPLPCLAESGTVGVFLSMAPDGETENARRWMEQIRTIEEDVCVIINEYGHKEA